MKRIELIQFGKIKNSAVLELADYYQHLLSRYIAAEVVTLRDPGERQIELRDLPKLDFICVLSEKGQEYETVALAKVLRKSTEEHDRISFVIANAYGVDPDLLTRADLTLSLSKLTFTHELSSVILLEQLYRCFNLNAGGKYHK